MGLKYKFYPDRNLLVDILNGEVTIDDIKKLHIEEQKNVDFNSVKITLSNVRKIKLKLSLNDVRELIRFMSDDSQHDIKWAIYTDNPVVTAFSVIVKMDYRYRNKLDIFSTLKGVNKFLETDYREVDFNDSDFINII